MTRKINLKRAILTTTAAIALTYAPGALAQESLEDRISDLEQMLSELKAELNTQNSAVADDIDRIEKSLNNAPNAESAPSIDGFTVGDTTFKIGGFIDADFHATNFSEGEVASNSIVRDFHIPGATPIGGSESTVTDFSAQASRISFTGQREVGDKKVTGYLELDFLGSAQGNELVSNSYSPRLRRAYIDYGNWRVGQEWTTFQNLSAIPESASFLALSDGMIFGRQAMVRYTSGNWQFAVENPNTTTLNVGSQDDNVLPDVIARYNAKGDYGNISIAAILRQLAVEQGTVEEEVFGWGLSVAGRLKVGEKDDIRFNLSGGEGLGRYIGLAASRAAAIDPIDGDIDAITSYGGLVAWRHPFGETARFNIGYSGLFVDNPDYLGANVTESVQSAYAAILWDPIPKVTLGTEILHGIRALEGDGVIDDEGDMTRITFSTKYAF